jgi:hypothetical protein
MIEDRRDSNEEVLPTFSSEDGNMFPKRRVLFGILNDGQSQETKED